MGTIGDTEEGVDYDEIVGPYLRRGEPGVYCPCMMVAYYGCSLLANVTDGPYAGVDVACAGLTLYSGAAAQFGIGLPAAFYVNELCQRYGMDMFGSFFYAYELYMRGIVSEETLGVRLELGDEEALDDEEPLDFERERRLVVDDHWQDEDLSAYDLEYSQDEWE